MRGFSRVPFQRHDKCLLTGIVTVEHVPTVKLAARLLACVQLLGGCFYQPHSQVGFLQFDSVRRTCAIRCGSEICLWSLAPLLFCFLVQAHSAWPIWSKRHLRAHTGHVRI